MSQYIVKTENLIKKFNNVNSVDKVNLKVREGEVYGFLGPNGAGKSTTIKMILGLIKPNSGKISVFGKSIKDNREEILKDIGALVESPSYYGHLTAYENLEILRRVLKVSKNEIEEKLKLVNLWDAKNKKVREFSLGMKQRLGIAQALMGNPKLLILDEPFVGLDPKASHILKEEMKKLCSEGVAIFFSTHVLEVAEKLCDKVAIIKDGNIVSQGKMDEVKGNSSLEDIFMELIDNE